ncbi:c-type cytochrome [Rhodovulum sp. DZ06]|uniref:c-type cytochrome n=1 Tax=Rhodovulum sp. DZ06 TaxID=3425126 RepID=UPI003D33C8C7
MTAHPLRLAALAAMLLGAPAIAPLPAAADTFEDVKILAGEALFVRECRRCHAPDADHDSYGPPLVNVVGRGAGTYPDYDYSVALEASGIVWTPAALRAWMEDNDGFMPGTKMRHVGIEDRTAQDFILSYLKSITTRDNSAIDKAD